MNETTGAADNPTVAAPAPADHWQTVWTTKRPDEVSWFQAEPQP